MDTVISFTPGQLWGLILGVCGGITAIAVCISWLVKGHNALKAPETRQNERITKLEQKMADHEEYLKRDNMKLRALEEGNKVTQKALIALLAHGIDGNEVEALRSAKKDLESYLINR